MCVKHYVIGDIHGCIEEYQLLLERLCLKSDDCVYILGDSIDRGSDSINVLKDIMNRNNFILILGNHEVLMMRAIRPFLMRDVTNESFHSFEDWMNNGGERTLEQFNALARWEQEEILEYLENSPAYGSIEYDGNLYILAHAGIKNFAVNKALDEYSVGDFVFASTDYNKRYYPSEKEFLITGHTPVQYIRKDMQPIIYTENNHIAIDCGCVIGGRLAAYCIETGEAIYVDTTKIER